MQPSLLLQEQFWHQPMPPIPMGDSFFYQPRILKNTESFTLLDSGMAKEYNGKKLEKIGGKLFSRPEPQALWAMRDETLWQNLSAEFDARQGEGMGNWAYSNEKTRDELKSGWAIQHGSVAFRAHLTPFRHYGFFPEQALLWSDMADTIATLKQNQQSSDKLTALNLFAYSGMASLWLAGQGLAVTHVDASKKAIQYAEENIAPDWGVRLLIDDAMDFVKREIRRRRKYNLILLDPPKFGRGPKGQAWDLWRDLPPLLADLSNLITTGGMVVLTCYAIRASCTSIAQALTNALPTARKTIFGELSLIEEGRGFTIPQAIYAICYCS